MRTWLKNWRCGCLIAIVLCAIPLGGLGQGPGHEAATPFPQAQAPLELPSPYAERLPAQTGLPPDEAINPQVGASAGPLASQLTLTDLAAPRAAFPFGYNLRQSNTSWLVGDGDKFGIFSLEAFPSLSPGPNSGIVAGLGFHFLGGPIQTDMPPRLFDFQLGYQQRKWATDTFGYDLSARCGVFSDFEGSARNGVRFPGHAVGYYRWNPLLELVLGMEYLDRDDISLLPVAGVIISPRSDLRLELVFPRPRVEVWISPTQALYLSGELGGGTWAIERMTMTNDVVTYRDLRLLLGILRRDAAGSQSGLEIGYVFSRTLSYRSSISEFAPDDTLLIQATHRY